MSGDFTAVRPHVYVSGAIIYAVNHNENEEEIYTSFNASLIGASGHQHTGTDGDGMNIPYDGLDLVTILAGDYDWTGDHTFSEVVKFGTTDAVPATFTGIQQYTSSTSEFVALFESSSAGATGAEVSLYHSTASPANNDVPGKLNFYGKDSAANDQLWAQIRVIISDVTSATEDSALAFYTADAGSVTENMRISSDSDLLIGRTSENTIGATRLDVLDTGSAVATFESTNNSSTGVVVQLFHNRTAVAADNIGAIRFAGNDNAGNATNYARIIAVAETITNGSEDGTLNLQVLVAGTNTTGVSINGDEQKVALASGWDLNIQAATRFYLDGGGDTYLSESSANNVTLTVGGTDLLDFTSSSVLPASDGVASLGSTSVRFSGLNLESGGQLHFANSGFNGSYISGTTSTLSLYGANGAAFRGVTVGYSEIAPTSDNTVDCGTAALAWDDIYAHNALTVVSDERRKINIEESDLGLDFIKSLTPISWTWKGESKNRGRNYGLGAQTVEKILSGKSFSGLSMDVEKDFYGLRMEQFIAPIIKAIQELAEKIE